MRFAPIVPATRTVRQGVSRTLVIAALLATAIPAAAVWGVAGDPTDPALAPPLPPSPASATISGDSPHYYQYADLDAGDYFTLDLSCETDFYPVDMALYAGQTNDPFAEVAVSAVEGPDEYISWLVPPGAQGRYTVEIKTSLGLPEATWRLDWSDATTSTPRLWGQDRYETSYAISRSTFATATTAVIASGGAFPDALAAAGLAGVFDGPVLLTKGTSVPLGLIRELVRLEVKKIYVVGGTSAVSDSVFTQLQSIGAITGWERVSGRDRYETAKKVAEEIWRETGNPASVGEAFVVRGDDFADALAVSPFAYHEGIPVLLTKPGVLSGYSDSFIRTYHVQDVYIAGGEAAVSADVMQSLEAIAQGDVYRWSGDNRYATAARVAEQGMLAGFATDWSTVGVATGVSFPDALSGGASAGMYGGPLLLTKGTSLSPDCAAAIGDHSSEISRLLVFGGEAAVNEGVVVSAANLLE